MLIPFPAKPEREAVELQVFLRAYRHVPPGRSLEVIRKRERPDYELRDPATSSPIGLELTSAYESDHSVAEFRRGPTARPPIPPYDPDRIARYLDRLLAAVRSKIHAAKQGYDLYPEMVLSCFLGDNVAICVNTPEQLDNFIRRAEAELGDIRPFTAAVFPNFPNDYILHLP